MTDCLRDENLLLHPDESAGNGCNGSLVWCSESSLYIRYQLTHLGAKLQQVKVT